MDQERHWQAVLALVTGTDRLVSAPNRELIAKKIIEEAEALARAFEASAKKPEARKAQVLSSDLEE